MATGGQLEDLLRRSGISNETTVVLYGDNSNWFASYGFWLLKYYGHADVRLMNGGRNKWKAEGRELTTNSPTYQATSYSIGSPDEGIRAKRDFILKRIGRAGISLVDVRSPGQFCGELLAPEHLSQEGAQRGGHIPGAQNIVWSEATNEDGTFKSEEELRALYEGQGVTPDNEVIAYCRIGERSSHTWFALKCLLGYPNVRNYDGSWTEWGSLIDAPIEKPWANAASRRGQVPQPVRASAFVFGRRSSWPGPRRRPPVALRIGRPPPAPGRWAPDRP